MHPCQVVQEFPEYVQPDKRSTFSGFRVDDCHFGRFLVGRITETRDHFSIRRPSRVCRNGMVSSNQRFFVSAVPIHDQDLIFTYRRVVISQNRHALPVSRERRRRVDVACKQTGCTAQNRHAIKVKPLGVVRTTTPAKIDIVAIRRKLGTIVVR